MVRENESNGMGGTAPTKRRHGAEPALTTMQDMPELAAQANERFVGFVREQPLVALGAACAVGYVLGRMLRRVM